MNNDLKLIKTKYGENMMHLCREYFPILLETPGLLPDLLLKKFEPSHDLYQDLVDNNLLIDFKNYIYGLVNIERKEEISVNKSPEELLSAAGYILYECYTEEDIQKFKKYYAPGEELCTFKGGRLDTCRVFFAVKKDVDKIKREDFKNPTRQDLYGTSVISIQFSKDGTNTLSIKNRYNHHVDHPDATFSNYLDNIISGLTKSFETYYRIVQKYKNSGFEIPGYVMAIDGKFYKYNYEIDGTYYCPNNIILDNIGRVVRYPKEKYIVFDYFILDLVNKKVSSEMPDGFKHSLKDIKKIEIIKNGEEKIIYITLMNGDVIEITLDKNNRIIGLVNSNMTKIGSGFLYLNTTLKKLVIPNVEKIGMGCLQFNNSLTEFNAPNVKSIDSFLLGENRVLLKFNAPLLENIALDCLRHNSTVEDLYVPNLDWFCDNNILREHPNRDELLASSKRRR